jgi:hypothetical protein
VSRAHVLDAKTIKGFGPKHVVRSMSYLDKTLLHVHEFSCFCLHCEGKYFVVIKPRTSYNIVINHVI